MLLWEVDKATLDKVDIDEMYFGFMPGCGNKKVISVLRQLQEKYLVKKK